MVDVVDEVVVICDAIKWDGRVRQRWEGTNKRGRRGKVPLVVIIVIALPQVDKVKIIQEKSFFCNTRTHAHGN